MRYGFGHAQMQFPPGPWLRSGHIGKPNRSKYMPPNNTETQPARMMMFAGNERRRRMEQVRKGQLSGHPGFLAPGIHEAAQALHDSARLAALGLVPPDGVTLT